MIQAQTAQTIEKNETADSFKRQFFAGLNLPDEVKNDATVTEVSSLPHEKTVISRYLSETRWLTNALKTKPSKTKEILRVLAISKNNSRILGFSPVYKLYHAVEDVYKGIVDDRVSFSENLSILLSSVAKKIEDCCDCIERDEIEELSEINISDHLVYLDKAVTGELFDARHLAPQKALPAPKHVKTETVVQESNALISVQSKHIGELVNQHEEMIARTYILMNQVELLKNALNDGDMKSARESYKQLLDDSQNLQNSLLISHDQLLSFMQDDSFLARHQDFQGFFVLANGRKYLIPAEFIVDVISNDPLDYETKQNQKFVVYIQETESGNEKAREDIPVYALSSLLPGKPLGVRQATDTIIIVDYQSQKIGIIVDLLLKFVSLIKNPMPRAFKRFPILKGLAFDEKYDMIPILSIPDIMKRFLALRGYDMKKFEVGTKKRAKRVLVVEDSDTTRLIEQTILMGNGFSVVEARDGIEAMEKIKKQHFDLILCDDNMPRMNGEIFLDNVRRMEETAQTPVLAVSEKAIPNANRFMSKSEFKREVFVEKVKELLHE